MKMPKVDFKKIAMQTAGEGGGLLALGALQKVKFVAEAKPAVKGLIYKALGAFVGPLLAGKAKKGNELIEGASNALSVAGTSQIINAFKPGMVPAIGGYEDYPINGPGYEMEEDDIDVGGPNEDEEDIMS